MVARTQSERVSTNAHGRAVSHLITRLNSAADQIEQGRCWFEQKKNVMPSLSSK